MILFIPRLPKSVPTVKKSSILSQPCSKSTIETLAKGVKYIEKLTIKTAEKPQ